MKLRALFISVMTCITVLIIFLIGDAVLAGLIALVVAIFNTDEALEVFKYTVIALGALQVPLVLFLSVKMFLEDVKKDGT